MASTVEKLMVFSLISGVISILSAITEVTLKKAKENILDRFSEYVGISKNTIPDAASAGLMLSVFSCFLYFLFFIAFKSDIIITSILFFVIYYSIRVFILSSFEAWNMNNGIREKVFFFSVVVMSVLLFFILWWIIIVF